jgi:hypothetical protein
MWHAHYHPRSQAPGKAVYHWLSYHVGSRRQRNLLRTTTRSLISFNCSCVIAGAKISRIQYPLCSPNIAVNVLPLWSLEIPECPYGYLICITLHKKALLPTILLNLTNPFLSFLLPFSQVRAGVASSLHRFELSLT